MHDSHKFDPVLLREYDIRGIVGDNLHLSDALALGRAFGSKIIGAGGMTVCVGYDGRLSSPDIELALVEGLKSTGLDVRCIGLGPTPMLYYSVFELNTDGGIMITGSHNPPDYNGFKMMLGQQACFGSAIQELGRIAAAGAFEKGAGSVSSADIFDRYINRIFQDFEGAALNVAWDPGNGAAGDVITALVEKLPGRHVVINGEIDGNFPAHHPDPTVEENLEQLKAVVRKEKLDLGLAFDGDGDRIGAVDAKGRVVWGDQLLAILAKDVLAELPGSPIIADVKASQVLFDEIEKMGGRPVMWKTGHSLIKTKMLEEKAPLAGEMSGHIFFKHKYYGFDDAIYAAIRLLNVISKHGGSLADLRDALPHMVNTPELRFECPEDRKTAIVEEVRTRLKKQGADLNEIDGVRVNTKDGWWLLRASNTQAVLVARCEGSDEASLSRLKEALVTELRVSGIEPPDGL